MSADSCATFICGISQWHEQYCIVRSNLLKLLHMDIALITRNWGVVAALIALTTVSTTAGTIRGQISDSTTDLPVEGVEITVNPGGESATSGPFGFYTLRNVPPGNVTLATHHGAFVDKNHAVTATNDEAIANLEIVPNVEFEFLDFYIVVRDAKTGFQIPDIPVEIRRYDSSGDTVPEVFDRTTDSNGTVTIRGMKGGEFELETNSQAVGGHRPGWETCITNRQRFSASQIASVMLKHTPQTVKFSVKGYDPVEDEDDQPLENVWVEITGVHPDDDSIQLVHPQSALTDASGMIAFSNLNAIHWKVTTKKLGYRPAEHTITPDDDDVLEGVATAFELNPELNATSLDVSIVSEKLLTTRFYDQVEFTLLGIDDTHTDGIDRSNSEAADGDVGKRLFENLLPGRYVLAVNDYSFSEDELDPEFSFIGSMVVDVIDNMTTMEDFEVDIVGANIRGALNVADEIGNIDKTGGTDFFASTAPVYKGHETEEGVDVELRIADDFADEVAPECRIITVKTDQAGNFTADGVLPGRYGIVLPTMTDYWGNEVFLHHETEDDAAEQEPVRSQGWPYYRWTHAGTPPANFAPAPGNPLIIDSANYSIDLYANKKIANVYIPVFDDPLNATSRLLSRDAEGDIQESPFSDLLALPATATLSGPGGTRTVNLESAPGGFVGPLAIFRNLLPGTYTYTIEHERFDIGGIVIPGLPPLPQTFTVPEWGDAPGLQPATDPALLLPNILPVYLTLGALLPPTATYKEGGDIKFRIWHWDETAEPKEYVQSGDEITARWDVVRPDYAGGLYFASSSAGIFPERPYGSFTFWSNFGEGVLEGSEDTGWFQGQVVGTGEATFDLYFAGPTERGPRYNLNAQPPTPTQRVVLRAANIVTEDQGINGVTFTLGSGEEMKSFTADANSDSMTVTIPTQYKGKIEVTSADHPSWTFVQSRVEPPSGFSNQTTILVGMKRGMAVMGSVKMKTGPKSPIAGAKVKLFDRFGRTLRAGASLATTDEQGAFDFSQALNPDRTEGYIYVDVTARGFKPFRKRISATDPEFAAGTGDIDVNLTIELEAAPPPVIATDENKTKLDRFGLFLPGVSLSSSQPLIGDGETSQLGRAEDELRMTWNAEAESTTYPIESVAFDNADGTPGMTTMKTITDRIVHVAFIDPRIFPGHPHGHNPGIAREANSVKFDPPFDPDKPFDQQDIPAMIAWLDAITSQDFSDYPDAPDRAMVPWIAHDESQFMESGNTVTVTGEEMLWMLPPGRYAPVVAVEAASGALSFHQFEYESDADKEKQLRGLRLPPYLAFLADLMATTANVAGTVDEVQGWLETVHPKGRFLPLPDMEGKIEQIDGFLKYDYGVKVQWNEGEELPGAEIGGVALGFLGIPFEAELHVTVDGKESKAAMEAKATIDSGNVDLEEYLPRSFPKPIRDILDFEAWASGSAGTLVSEQFDEEASPLEFVQKINVQGAVGGRIDLDLEETLLKRTPSIAPIVIVLDAVAPGAINASGFLRGAVGLESISTWTTKYPKPPGLSVIAGTGHEMAHFAGGLVDEAVITPVTKFDQEFNICMNFGVGLTLDLGGVAGGELSLDLQGNNCALPRVGGSVPSLKATLNPQFGSWPIVKEIDGSLNANLNVYLDVWLTRFEKDWSWELFPIKHQFGTASQVQFVPMTTAVRKIGMDEIEATDFIGTSPQVIRHFVSRSGFKALSNQLAFAHTDDNGVVSLRVALRTNDGTWGDPVTVSSIPNGGGIVSLDVAHLPNGGTMAVWTEIDGTEANNAFPPSKILYSISSNGGTNWSDPSVAAEFDYVADDLHLVSNGDITALIYQCASMGADSNERAINGMLYTNSWSAATQLVAPAPLLDLDASAGTSGNAAIAYATQSGQVGAFRWGGGAAPTITEVDTNGGGAVDVIASNAGSADVYWAAAEGIRKRTLGVLPSMELIIAGVQPRSIDVAGEVITWVQGGQLYYGMTSGESQMMPVTGNLFGAYDNVNVTENASGTYSILASFTNGSDELRAFHVMPGSGTVLADQDSDSMLDITELHIVDADQNDNLRTIVDVLPSGDFDGDGKTNMEEHDEGTDPTDSGSFTGDGPIGGDKPSDRWLAANAPGTGWLEDRDFDGLVTLAEYLLEGDPDHPDAGDKLIPGTSNDGRPTLTYTYRNEANVQVSPQASDDGMSWSGDGVEAISTIDNGDGTTTATVAGPMPDGDSATLMRLLLRLE